MSEFSRLQFKMAPERICFLRFIFEGYDNMAIQSTIDARQGLVEIRYPVMVEDEVLALLEHLAPSLGVDNLS